MAYGEYANETNCPGRCLHQLSTMGVPVLVAESVTFAGDGLITYRGKPFADYEWLEDGTPYFTFSSAAPHSYPELQARWFAANYARLQVQAKAREVV